jgi:catalase
LSELDTEQPRDLYHKVFNDKDRVSFVKNILNVASNVSDGNIKQKIPQYWGLVDRELWALIAQGLCVDYYYLSAADYTDGIGNANIMNE